MSKTPTAAESIKKLEDKDGEANNESARTNEILASHAGSDDAVKDSIKANDPSLSRSAHTSHKTGFNEDLSPPDDTPIPGKSAKGQTKTVNK